MNSQQSFRSRPSRTFAAIVAGLAILPLAFAPRASATPYATELTNNAGIVSFTLNETNDNVKIIFGSTTNDLGPLNAGSYTINVGAFNPFFVQVTKNSGAGFKSATAPLVAGKIQISNDPFLATGGGAPATVRGLTVNKNPASPFFGRIYFDQSTPGVRAWTNPITLEVTNVYRGRGLYTLKSDFSDSPNGYFTNAQTGGLTFATDVATGGNSPYHLTVGADDRVYVADFSDTNGMVARVDGNLLNGELVLDYIGGFPFIQSPTNHGSIKRIRTTGSIAGGNLKVYTLDEDYTNAIGTSAQSIWRYDIDSGPLTDQSEPTFISRPSPDWTITGTQDFVIGTNGYIYAMQNRSAGSEPGLYVIDLATGNSITNSRDMWSVITGNGLPATNDILRNLQSIALSPDHKILALNLLASAIPAGSDCWIIPLGANGIPDLANRTVLDSGAISQGRGVDFDLAGNLYTISSGDGVVRAWSPGGFSVATTGNNGTLTLLELPDVSVQVTTAVAAEAGPVNGVFTLTRTGSTADPLTVGYTIAGTATNGVDYTTISDSVTFLPSESTTNVTIVPNNDSIAELTETVTFSLKVTNTYNTGVPSSGTLAIVDNETPELSITNLHAQMFERTNDYARYQITRSGDTNAALFTVNLSFTGSATSGVDYYADTVTFNPGEVTKTFQIYALDDALVETNETVICSLAAGAGYTIGSPSSATVTIVNATLPPEDVLFSDNFDTDTTASWTQRFGSTNGIEDNTFTFNYDYSADSIPSAPHSTGGTTRGLKMTVNKIEASAFGAAGINFYPNGQNFSGDFALRFDMYLIDAGGASATEGALFGINHSGTKTNWFRLSGGGPPPGLTFDGLFFDVLADNQSSLNAYALWSPPLNGNNPTKLTFTSFAGLTGIFKAPPWAVAGLPSNLIPSANSIWADVEASQINNVVTLKVNGTQILSYTNTGGTTSGNIMIGYVDPFDSIGLSSSAVVFDNVRVVRAFQYRITNVLKLFGAIAIDFTHPDTAEPASSFKLQSSATVDGPYADFIATITETGIGTYHVYAPAPDIDTIRYYRIKRLF